MSSFEPAAEPAPINTALIGAEERVDPPVTSVPTKSRKGFTFLFIAAYFATMMAVITPVVIAISLKLLQIAPQNTANTQALVLGIGAIFAALTNPIAGFLSDRSTSRFGRRKIYLLVGVLLGVVGLAVMALATQVPLLIVGWAVVQTGFNVVFASLYGLMADQIPAARRGRISGMIGLGQALGIFGGVGIAALFPTQLALTFLIPAGIALVVVGVLSFLAPDRRQTKADIPPFRPVDLVQIFWVSPRKYPDFGWAWAGRFLFIFANSAATSFTALFLIARFGFAPAQVAQLTFLVTIVGLVVNAVASPLGGYLSDRFKRRKVFAFAAAVIFTIGVIIICIAPDFGLFILGSAVLGLGSASYIAIDLALATDVLPDNGARAGKDLGVFNLANTIPQSLAPAVAPVLLGIGAAAGGANYVALFIAAAVVSVLGAISVFFVKGVR